ncbi:hypothetical protein VNO78_11360 [Psophocarpus tetragonolobus]|uniref:Uncharacterized protein n=1 Tax=Psophocarpus tetragonolobus TaxID=3891 RepID=A0AAN9SLB1_PSOTE
MGNRPIFGDRSAACCSALRHLRQSVSEGSNNSVGSPTRQASQPSAARLVRFFKQNRQALGYIFLSLSYVKWHDVRTAQALAGVRRNMRHPWGKHGNLGKEANGRFLFADGRASVRQFLWVLGKSIDTSCIVLNEFMLGVGFMLHNLG